MTADERIPVEAHPRRARQAWLRRGVLLGAAAAAGTILGSLPLAGTIVAGGLLLDRGVAGGAGCALRAVALGWLCCVALVVARRDMVDYRLAAGRSWIASSRPIAGGLDIEVLIGHSSSTRSLLPGLTLSTPGGDARVHVFLHDLEGTAARGRLRDARVGEKAIQRIHEVRWYEQGTGPELGWFEFQSSWGDTGGRSHAIRPPRLGLAADPVDLRDARSVDLRFVIEIDRGSGVEVHPVEIALEKEWSSWSGLVIHTP